jgi:hypothetical protein
LAYTQSRPPIVPAATTILLNRFATALALPV